MPGGIHPITLAVLNPPQARRERGGGGTARVFLPADGGRELFHERAQAAVQRLAQPAAGAQGDAVGGAIQERTGGVRPVTGNYSGRPGGHSAIDVLGTKQRLSSQ